MTGESAASVGPVISPEAAAGGHFPVHVAGGVSAPSVITADSNMVVQDAINSAGGATDDADLGRLNLAARLIPNSRVYVPVKGEFLEPGELDPYGPGAPRVSSANPSPSGRPAGVNIGLININTATETQLQVLKGVGPVTARKIIDYRNSVGGFADVDQLIEVKGIGPKKLSQIRPFVTVN